MAAIDFTKAVFETKSMQKLYDDSDFDKLESGIEKICNDLRQQVFGEATKLDKQDWMQQAMMPKLKWLSQLDTIRERVHETSGVQMLHINEHEAEVVKLRNLVQRLTAKNEELTFQTKE